MPMNMRTKPYMSFCVFSYRTKYAMLWTCDEFAALSSVSKFSVTMKIINARFTAERLIKQDLPAPRKRRLR